MKVHVGQYIEPNVTGNKSYTGVGFQPNLLLVWSFLYPTPGNTYPSLRFMHGVATATSEYSVSLNENTAQNPSNASCASGAVIHLNQAGAAVSVSASLVSLDADGFTLNFTKVDGVQRSVNYMALQVTNPQVGVITTPASVGQLYTNIGVPLDCGIILGNGLPSVTTYSTAHSTLSYGLFDASLNQVGLASVIQGAVSPTNVNRYHDTMHAVHQLDTLGATVAQADIDLVDATGFRLNFTTVPTTPVKLFYATWEADGAQVIPSHPVPAVVSQETVTTGFFPHGVISAGGGLTAAQQNAVTADMAFHVGGMGMVGTNRGNVLTSRDNVAAASNTRTDIGKLSLNVDPVGGTIVDKGAGAPISTGFTLDWVTASAGLRTMAYLAFGDLAPPTGYTDRILSINENYPGARDGPTHYWDLVSGTEKGSSPSPRTMTPGTIVSGTAAFTGPQLAVDAATSLAVTGDGYASITDANDTNLLADAYQTRSFSLWASVANIDSPTVIFKEGGGVNNFAIGVGIGGLMWVQAAAVSQFFVIDFADVVFHAGIPYHIAFTWERGTIANGGLTRVRLWLNGVQQPQTTNSSFLDSGVFPAHSGDLAIANMGPDLSGGGLKFYNESTLNYSDADKDLAQYAIYNDYLFDQTDVDALFLEGAMATTSLLTVEGVVADASRSLHSLDTIGGDPIAELVSGVVRDPVAETKIITYPITTTQSARLRVIKYGFLPFEADLNLTRLDARETAFFITDTKITEADPAVVRAYATIDNLDQAYDRAQAYDEDTPSNGYAPFITSGALLKPSDNHTVVIDSAAPAGWGYSDPLITLKPATTLGKGTTFTGIDGDVEVASLTDLSDMDVTGNVEFQVAGTYILDGTQLNTVTNTSGGAVTLRLLNGATVASNIGPNITLVNAYPISAPNLIDNTVVQIYNTTTDTIEDYAVVSGGGGYSFTSGSALGDVIRLRAAYAVGTTYKRKIEATATMGASGIVFSDIQEAWTEIEGFGLDGSLMTEFSSDFVNVQVDVADPDGVTEKRRLIAWWAWAITDVNGIHLFFDAIDVLTPYFFQVNAALGLQLDNVNSFPVIFSDTETRLVMSDSSTIIAAASGSIQIEQGRVPPLAQATELETSAFNGRVTIDILNGVSGTDYPRGTFNTPVNNFTDAVSIANSRKIKKFYILGDALINSSAGSLDGFEIEGESIVKSTISISDTASITNCRYINLTFSGILNGNSSVEECRTLNINYVSGLIKDSIIGPGIITLSGNNNASFYNCYGSIEGAASNIVDTGGSGQNLLFNNYSGELTLKNKTGPEFASFYLNQGGIVLDSTVASGIIEVQGIGLLQDNSGSGTIVKTEDLINKQHISEAVWNTENNIMTTANSAGKDLIELWRLQGLEVGNPMTVTETNRATSGINLTISGDTTVVVTRV